MSPHTASLITGFHKHSSQRTKPARKERKEHPARPTGKMQVNWTAALMLGPFFPG